MNSNKRINYNWILVIFVGVISFIIYYLTAFRTFTWWDSSRYTLTVATLGVAPPPSSLILTLIGWVVSKIPFAHSIAFRLNILTAIMTSAIAILLSYIALKIIKEDRIPNIAMFFAVIIGGLTFAFSKTLWDYARHFTPYTLTALFTTFIILALLSWWKHAEEKQAWIWVFLIFLLFGLDFSVHRTNILLLPGVFLWIGLRRVQTYKSYETWLALIFGFLVGFAFQLVMIPMAIRNPFMNFYNPNSFTRFWDYVTLKPFGGGWLINLLPRKAPFFKIQVMDYLKMFISNFTVLPIAFGIIGIIRHFYANWKKALCFLLFFLLASIGAVIYFNTSADYFRTMDRHYMPSFLFFAFWICYGIAFLIYIANKLPRILKLIAIIVIVLVSIFMPVRDLISNYYMMDASHNFYAEDFARNMLVGLPENSIIITNGDNDTFPLWCLQYVENFRKDVSVLNISLLNTDWFIKQIISRDTSFPIRLSQTEIDSLRIIKWRDTIVAIPINKKITFGLPSNIATKDYLSIRMTPTKGDSFLLVHDQIVLNILKNNNWQRPIYSATTLDARNIPWLRPYFCLEGLAYRIVPIDSYPVNIDAMKDNLLNHYQYRGYNDKRVYIDEVSHGMVMNYLWAFVTLAQTQKEAGKKVDCLVTLDYLEKVFPVARLQLSKEIISEFTNITKTLREN